MTHEGQETQQLKRLYEDQGQHRATDHIIHSTMQLVGHATSLLWCKRKSTLRPVLPHGVRQGQDPQHKEVH